MPFGQYGQETHWVQQPSFEAGVTSRHDRHIGLAAIKQVAQLGATSFLQLDFDQRMATFILREKVCQKILDHLRRGADAKKASLPPLQSSRPLTQQADVCQQTAAMAQQVLALRRQSN